MPRLRITFRQSATFATAARLGSLTKAADALHLTQFAVSIQVRAVNRRFRLALGWVCVWRSENRAETLAQSTLFGGRLGQA
ncbi:LysR family transcriptional regulator [Accumulibacter sp.]|uniref:helix-turn-helix domain-containing protein n=1 Tax=Accumulibacter sp. TaxID=2053492 RepID=UPI00257F3948|nr:LysR family transcriptional regulator [Accumulibacter sp.]